MTTSAPMRSPSTDRSGRGGDFNAGQVLFSEIADTWQRAEAVIAT